MSWDGSIYREDCANEKTAAPVRPGITRLYEDKSSCGFSIDQVEVGPGEVFVWADCISRGYLCFCINQVGLAWLKSGSKKVVYPENTVGYYSAVTGKFRAIRLAGERHSFVSIALTPGYVEQHLSGYEEQLDPGVRAWLEGRQNDLMEAPVAVSTEVNRVLFALLHPPLFLKGIGLWYQSKVAELVSLVLFARSAERPFPGRGSGSPLERERVMRVLEMLRANLVSPPELVTMGRYMGCNAFYLSRTFSKVMGKTIPQVLQDFRVTRAAELIRTEECTTRQAAVRVGYSSLSHFSKAFRCVMGCGLRQYCAENGNRPLEKRNSGKVWESEIRYGQASSQGDMP